MAVSQPSLVSSPNRALAATAAGLFSIWGILGFFFTHEKGHQFFGPTGGLLWNAFLVNPAICAIWVLIAALLLINAFATVTAARGANRVVGVILLVLAVYGFVFMHTSANVFASNTTDNVFHLVVGLVLLATAFGADKQNIAALRGAARTV